jgi:hypothetical protein
MRTFIDRARQSAQYFMRVLAAVRFEEPNPQCVSEWLDEHEYSFAEVGRGLNGLPPRKKTDPR